jgi:hypothetical protein
MNSETPTGHGWILPTGQIIWATHAAHVIPVLLRHDPAYTHRLNQQTTSQWLQDLYIDGHVRIGRCNDRIVFEHGVNHKPDLITCIRLRGSLRHKGQLLTPVTQLYQPDLPARARYFVDP